MALTLTALIFTILTATVKAGEFLSPWTAGATKDYSHNINYAVGVHILAEWEADFTNATIALNQDNKPGDAQGGPNVILERSYNQTTWGWTVTYGGMDPALNNVFYFAVSNGNDSESFTGHYFNISDASTTASSATAAPSTAGSASSSMASSTTTTPASSGLKTPQPTSSSPATVTVAPSNGGGTPVGTIAGMVVGIVVGSLLLVGGAWWAWKVQKRRRRNINTAASKVQPAAGFASSQPYFYGGGGGAQNHYEADDGIQTYEVHESAGVPVHELRESVRGPMYELHGSGGQPRG